MINSISAIIVDDENNSIEVLKRLIQLNCPQLKVVEAAQSVDEAIQKIGLMKPDLVFLDIQMPKASGFDLLKHYGTDLPFQLIFVTSYDQFALSAIKFSALDYLLKPVDVNELKEAVNKAIEKVNNQKSVAYLYETLFNNISSSSINQSIVVHDRDHVNVVRFNEINYLESDGRYSKLILNDGRTLVVARILKDFEDYINEKSPLQRINKSAIINVNYLKSYSKGEPCIIEMNSGTTFEVSRRRKQEILQRLKNIN